MAANTSLSNSKNRSYELKKLKAQCVKEENGRYHLSQINRRKGSVDAEAGNVGLKSTKGDVYIYVISSQEEQIKTLQEQFKSTHNYRKTKSFSSCEELRKYIQKSRFPKQSILISIVDFSNMSVEAEESQLNEVESLKKIDPSMDVMALTTNANFQTNSNVDFIVLRNQDYFSKIISNISWAIREQERIRRQVESKQFIQMAIIVFFAFFISVFAVDFISGLLSPLRQGLLGIVPIPQP